MTNKFKVGDTVKVIGNKNGGWAVGTVGEIINISNCFPPIEVNSNGDSWWHTESELEMVNKPTETERITTLEETVAKQGEEIEELKLIVAQIRKPSTVVEEALANDTIEFKGKQYKKVDREARLNDVIIFNSKIHPHNGEQNKPYLINRESAIGAAHYDGNSICDVTFNIYEHGRNIKNVDVYELIVEDKPKTANQLRAEIIEKAKGFVESRTNDGEQLVPQKSGIAHWFIRNFEFVVNEAKRTVVVLCKSFDGKRVYERGIAKCMPGDVFNEHIGKAIALGRALGLDVSEFEQAVQPTLPRKGMIVRLADGEIYQLKYNHHRIPKGERILNDTDAIYGGVE